MTIFDEAYYGLLWTVCSIVFLYNFVKSVASHKRNAGVANALKTAFNFSGLVRAIVMLGKAVAPTATLFHECSVVEHLLMLASALFRLSLVGFLLWRLKQVEHRKVDRYIAMALFAFTTAFQLMYLGFFKSILYFDAKQRTSYCTPINSAPIIATHWAFIIVDFAIDIFAAIRLLSVLNSCSTNCNCNVHHEVPQPSKPNYFHISWNSLSLSLVFAYHVLSAINAKYYDQISTAVIIPMFVIMYFALSYIVTNDREIVHGIDQDELPFSIAAKPRITTKTEVAAQRVSEEQRVPLLSAANSEKLVDVTTI